MQIQEVIRTINQMQADGVVERYAIGGAAEIESGVLDAVRFQVIIARHGLAEAWRKFERQFLSEAP